MTVSVVGPVGDWSRSHVWGRELEASAALETFDCEFVCTYRVSWVWVMCRVSGVELGCVPFSEVGDVGSVVSSFPVAGVARFWKVEKEELVSIMILSYPLL